VSLGDVKSPLQHQTGPPENTKILRRPSDAGLLRSDLRSDRIGASVRSLVRSDQTIGLLGSETPDIGDDNGGRSSRCPGLEIRF
jgi:hypothetical protein